MSGHLFGFKQWGSPLKKKSSSVDQIKTTSLKKFKKNGSEPVKNVKKWEGNPFVILVPDIIRIIIGFLLEPIGNNHSCASISSGASKYFSHESERKRTMRDWKNVQLVCKSWKRIVDESLKMNFCNNWAFTKAAGGGHVVAVKKLLIDENVDPTAASNLGLKWAAQNGHLETVKLIIEDGRCADFTEIEDAARRAKKGGKADVETFLTSHLLKLVFEHSNEKS
eukprot:TRINITY_DN6280_c0_g1_i1.p2 TRINITY_DN6280_c0_g1~~TRINITY_DN6280_c0_g1_i1.p2  ORF type:complete len:223 (-),score=62.66 TRINITY_DN6280_c0_g1_i1:931-1599(-)